VYQHDVGSLREKKVLRGNKMSRFKTMFGVIEESEINKLNKVCRDISLKDSTFSYVIKKPRAPELIKKFVGILIIYSDSEEMANKRGGWFLHVMKDAKVSDYFWIKICKGKCV